MVSGKSTGGSHALVACARRFKTTQREFHEANAWSKWPNSKKYVPHMLCNTQLDFLKLFCSWQHEIALCCAWAMLTCTLLSPESILCLLPQGDRWPWNSSLYSYYSLTSFTGLQGMAGLGVIKHTACLWCLAVYLGCCERKCNADVRHVR